MRYAMIMAGGSGTRLWPMSRQERPKQLIPFIRGKSLLEIAAERIEELVPHSNLLIGTSESFRGPIRQALPQFTEEQIIGEPTGQDTVNAIALTAAVLEKRDPDAVFAVLTADHLITPEDRFRATLTRGFELVEQGMDRLVTFTIDPTYPAPQYGYVHRTDPIDDVEGAFRVDRFVEKPGSRVKAQALLDEGGFGWNSGMFVFSARGFLRVLERFKPEIHAGIRSIQDAWGTDAQQETLESVYPTLEKVSVDYAIMEPAADATDLEVCTVLMQIDWIDVGSWPSFGETLADREDASGNRADARFAEIDSTNVIAVSDDPDHQIAAIGCADLIIVHTAAATLVCHRDHAETVKQMATRVVDESLR